MEKKGTEKKRRTRDPEQKRGRVKKVIAVLAVINLIFLFVFDYHIPGLSRVFGKMKTEENHALQTDTGQVDVSEGNGSVRITFAEETLTYDGTGELDLLDGVLVEDADGNALDTKDLFAEVQEGSNKDSKIITYTYQDQEGNPVKAQRNLELQGYAGVSIAVPEELPDLTEKELASPTEAFLTKGLLAAKDGYGKDISANVKGKVAFKTAEGPYFDITFSVTNMFQDKASTTVRVKANLSKPIIGLTKTSVSIKKGEAFHATDYVEYALDKDGKDLSARLQVDDTGLKMNEAGTYTVTYKLQNAANEAADEVALTVKVIEK